MAGLGSTLVLIAVGLSAVDSDALDRLLVARDAQAVLRALEAVPDDDPVASLAAREQALELIRQAEDRGYQSVLLNNLAQDQMRLHNYSEALIYLRDALELEASPARRAITFASIGICQFELNLLDEAQRSFEAAEALAREIGNQTILQWTWAKCTNAPFANFDGHWTGSVASRRAAAVS